ncbi:MAG TPA: prepilin-type N-terminal cleavage/methylation domain-containing protein [Stellaceae bacterium]|jgi:type II secretory pathway pseudopilin PulG
MRQRDSAAGFTLIETLVAFALVALLLLPLLRSFSTGIASTSRAGAVDGATLIAQSTIESLTPEAEAAHLVDVDQDEGPYHVAGRISLYGGDGVPSGQGLPLAPYQISVTVSWSDGARMRSIALDALRLGPPPATETGP